MKQLAVVLLLILVAPFLFAGCLSKRVGAPTTTSFYKDSPQAQAEEYCKSVVGDPALRPNVSGPSLGSKASHHLARLGAVNPLIGFVGLGMAVVVAQEDNEAVRAQKQFEREYAACIQTQLGKYYARK